MNTDEACSQYRGKTEARPALPGDLDEDDQAGQAGHASGEAAGARADADPGASLDAGPDVRPGERKLLAVLARHYPMRLTRAQLGTLARYAAKGGTFGDYFSRLKRRELIAEVGGLTQITEAGLKVAGKSAPREPMTTEELLALWRGALKTGAQKMLDALVEVYPRVLSRIELAERTGYEVSGGTFGENLGTLRRNGLIQVEGKGAGNGTGRGAGSVRASDTLFLTPR